VAASLADKVAPGLVRTLCKPYRDAVVFRRQPKLAPRAARDRPVPFCMPHVTLTFFGFSNGVYAMKSA